jgi:hypothetical protein
VNWIGVARLLGSNFAALRSLFSEHKQTLLTCPIGLFVTLTGHFTSIDTRLARYGCANEARPYQPGSAGLISGSAGTLDSVAPTLRFLCAGQRFARAITSSGAGGLGG